MRKGRLLKLARFLESLPEYKFNLNVIRRVNCQSTACAIGWCPRVWPKFWKVGKRPFEVGHQYKGYGVQLASFEGPAPSWAAARASAVEFFEITHRQVDSLFTGGDYPSGWDATAQQVAEAIRDFVRTHR